MGGSYKTIKLKDSAGTEIEISVADALSSVKLMFFDLEITKREEKAISEFMETVERLSEEVDELKESIEG